MASPTVNHKFVWLRFEGTPSNTRSVIFVVLVNAKSTFHPSEALSSKQSSAGEAKQNIVSLVISVAVGLRRQ